MQSLKLPILKKGVYTVWAQPGVGRGRKVSQAQRILYIACRYEQA